MSVDLGPYVRFSELTTAVGAVAAGVILDTEAARDAAAASAAAALASRQGAETAETNAETAETNAEAAQAAAEAAQAAALGSANAASGSASNAAQSAIDAGTARTGAFEAKDGAEIAEQAAVIAQGLAEAARDAAQGHASAASDSAGDAGQAASAALASGNAAAGSALLSQDWAEKSTAPGGAGTKSAKTWASDAQGFASAAAGSASAALASQNAAAGSAGAALTSANNAAASAVGAATLYGQLLALPVTGRTSGTPTAGTVTFTATEDLDVWTTGQATVSRVTSLETGSGFRLHTLTLNCPNGTAGTLVIKDAYKIRSFGNHRGVLNPNVNFYAGTDATAPILTWNFNNLPTSTQKIRQATAFATALPTSGNTAFPAGLLHLELTGTNIAWTFSGALPTGLTYLQFSGNNIAWTFSGALPTGLTYLLFSGTNIAWTFSGALPAGLTSLWLEGNSIAWTFSGALPAGLTLVLLLGNSIAWTGTVLGRTISPATFATLSLSNYRTSVLLDATSLTALLTSIAERTGTLPATVTVNEYDAVSPTVAQIQAASPNPAGTPAEIIRHWIEAIRAKQSGAKTFNLNATAITAP